MGGDGGDQPEGTGDVDVEGVLDVKLVLACSSNSNSNSTSLSAIRRKLKKERDLVGEGGRTAGEDDPGHKAEGQDVYCPMSMTSLHFCGVWSWPWAGIVLLLLLLRLTLFRNTWCRTWLCLLEAGR
jgi:hypothetical protein